MDGYMAIRIICVLMSVRQDQKWKKDCAGFQL